MWQENVWQENVHKVKVLTQAFLHALNAIYVSRISGKLSFCHFGTEFFKFLGKNYLILSFFKLFLLKKSSDFYCSKKVSNVTVFDEKTLFSVFAQCI